MSAGLQKERELCAINRAATRVATRSQCYDFKCIFADKKQCTFYCQKLIVRSFHYFFRKFVKIADDYSIEPTLIDHIVWDVCFFAFHKNFKCYCTLDKFYAIGAHFYVSSSSFYTRFELVLYHVRARSLPGSSSFSATLELVLCHARARSLPRSNSFSIRF
jgi:hypothetical protein